MSGEKFSVTCVACSIFKQELEALKASGHIKLAVRYINSMMHMRPERLRVLMDKVIGEYQTKGDDVLLLYGECHNHMDNYAGDESIKRVCGCNCVEILLGHDEYARLLKDGAFFLLPEWAVRWKEIFRDELDLKGEVGKEFMREMHEYFLYIDTALVPVPLELLNEISEELGIPWKVKQISTDHLLAEINKNLEYLKQ